MTTHCDVGLSPSVAYVLGEKPTIDYLCGNYDGGDGIRDSLSALQVDGCLPAAVDCPACHRVAELVHRGKSLKAARREARKMKPGHASGKGLDNASAGVGISRVHEDA